MLLPMFVSKWHQGLAVSRVVKSEFVCPIRAKHDKVLVCKHFEHRTKKGRMDQDSSCRWGPVTCSWTSGLHTSNGHYLLPTSALAWLCQVNVPEFGSHPLTCDLHHQQKAGQQFANASGSSPHRKPCCSRNIGTLITHVCNSTQKSQRGSPWQPCHSTLELWKFVALPHWTHEPRRNNRCPLLRFLSMKLPLDSRSCSCPTPQQSLPMAAEANHPK